MKTLRWIVFILVCLTTLVGLFYAVENWRGKHAWETWQRDREAKGDRYDWSSVVPPPVPDAENIAAAPIFAELFPKPPANPRLDQVRLPDCQGAVGNWRLGRSTDLVKWRACFTNDDLTAALNRYEPILREVETAIQRPHCRFPIRYEDHFGALLPHIIHLRNLARVYALRASTGTGDTALRDVRLCLRLASLLNDEPVLISFLVRSAILETALQPTWEGLAAHRWNEQQLATIQAEFAQLNECEHLVLAFQGERRFAYAAVRWLQSGPRDFSLWGANGMDKLLAIGPSGWFHQNLVRIDRFYVERMLPAIDIEHRRLNVTAANALDPKTGWPNPYNVLTLMLLPAVQTVPRRAALTQTAVDQLVAACALERFRLAHGELPNTLDALVPQYLATVPRDVIDGQPLRYRRDGLDKFTLWSVGWNQTDDGGEVVRNGDRLDETKGDWAWQQ
jgi:hypothetical protein